MSDGADWLSIFEPYSNPPIVRRVEPIGCTESRKDRASLELDAVEIEYDSIKNVVPSLSAGRASHGIRARAPSGTITIRCKPVSRGLIGSHTSCVTTFPLWFISSTLAERLRR